MNELLNCVVSRVSEGMNELLEKDYTVEEVKKALFDMAPSKAPGVDGFTAGFIKGIGMFWVVILLMPFWSF